MSYRFMDSTKDSVAFYQGDCFTLALPGQRDRRQGRACWARLGASETEQARRPQSPGRLSTDRLKESSGTPGLRTTMPSFPSLSVWIPWPTGRITSTHRLWIAPLQLFFRHTWSGKLSTCAISNSTHSALRDCSGTLWEENMHHADWSLTLNSWPWPSKVGPSSARWSHSTP